MQQEDPCQKEEEEKEEVARTDLKIKKLSDKKEKREDRPGKAVLLGRVVRLLHPTPGPHLQASGLSNSTCSLPCL